MNLFSKKIAEGGIVRQGVETNDMELLKQAIAIPLPLPQLSTLEVIRQEKINYVPEVPPENFEHLSKLKTLAGISVKSLVEYDQKSAEYQIVEPYITAGFRHIIKCGSIEKFAYSASLKGHVQVFRNPSDHYGFSTLPVYETGTFQGIRYVGDIPEFALDNLDKFNIVWDRLHIQTFQTLPISWGPGDLRKYDHDNISGIFTIIPQYTLTIHSAIPLPVQYNDPVVIDLRKTDPVLVAWLDYPQIEWGKEKTIVHNHNSIGFVIAVWDNDKEFEL